MAADQTLVGRAGELARIDAALAAARGGRGSATVFSGGPGIGRTRILATFIAQARADDLTLVLGRGGAGALWVVRASGSVPWDDLVDVVTAEVATSGWAAVTVDDLHLLEDDRVAVLESLIALTVSRPVVLMLAGRARQLPPRLATAIARADATDLLDLRPVGPLSLDEARDLVGDRPDLAGLHVAAGGNPLYLKALAGASIEATSSLVGELSRLDPPTLRAAQAAAVWRDPFSPDELAALLPDEPVLAALDRLVAVDLVRPVDPPRWAFRHPVVGRVVYRRTDVSLRRALHLRVDAELARRQAPVIQRAFHVVRAPDHGNPEHFPTLMVAAREVLNTDPRSAVTWAATARDLVPSSDPRALEASVLLAQAQYLRGPATEGEDTLREILRVNPHHSPEIARHVDIADLANGATDYPTATHHAFVAADLARRCGDRAAEALALSVAAFAQANHGQVDLAEESALAAARYVDAAEDDELVRHLPGVNHLGMAEAMLERLVEAERHLSRGLALAQRSGQLDERLDLLKTLADVHLRLGHLDRAVVLAQQAHEAGLRGGNEAIAILAESSLVEARFWHHGLDAVNDTVVAARRALAEAERQDWFWATAARIGLADILIQAGLPERGSEALLAATGGPTLPRIGPWRRLRWWDSLAGAAVAMGDASAAARYGELATAAAEVVPGPARRGFTLRTAMHAAMGQGDHPLALERADRAVEAFTARQMRLEASRTLVHAARISLLLARTEESEGRLDRAMRAATACGSQRLVDEVTGLREGILGGAYPTLTRREREIAALASTGASSNEIAHRLFLSVRTVESHLGRVYRKLGVASRTELAGRMLTPAGRP